MCGTPPGYCYGCSTFGFDGIHSPHKRAAIRGAVLGGVAALALGGPILWGAAVGASLNYMFGDWLDRKLRAA
jgi:hypothetical protein